MLVTREVSQFVTSRAEREEQPANMLFIAASAEKLILERSTEVSF